MQQASERFTSSSLLSFGLLARALSNLRCSSHRRHPFAEARASGSADVPVDGNTSNHCGWQNGANHHTDGDDRAFAGAKGQASLDNYLLIGP